MGYNHKLFIDYDEFLPQYKIRSRDILIRSAM